MVVNGFSLIDLEPIQYMLDHKKQVSPASYGLTECGYDIRIKQDVFLDPVNRFTLASSVEKFSMPNHLMGVVHDKSTWARRGVSVFNTVIEPTWRGWLTLEIVYHGNESIIIPAGSGIAQVVFHKVMNLANYEGKYQDQPDEPVGAK